MHGLSGIKGLVSRGFRMRRSDEPSVTAYVTALQRSVGRNLRRARTDAGLTQLTVSEVSGVARDMVGAVERGNANSTIRVLARLALAVGADVPAMLTPRE